MRIASGATTSGRSRSANPRSVRMRVALGKAGCPPGFLQPLGSFQHDRAVAARASDQRGGQSADARRLR